MPQQVGAVADIYKKKKHCFDQNICIVSQDYDTHFANISVLKVSKRIYYIELKIFEKTRRTHPRLVLPVPSDWFRQTFLRIGLSSFDAATNDLRIRFDSARAL